LDKWSHAALWILELVGVLIVIGAVLILLDR